MPQKILAANVKLIPAVCRDVWSIAAVTPGMEYTFERVVPIAVIVAE